MPTGQGRPCPHLWLCSPAWRASLVLLWRSCRVLVERWRCSLRERLRNNSRADWAMSGSSRRGARASARVRLRVRMSVCLCRYPIGLHATHAAHPSAESSLLTHSCLCVCRCACVYVSVGVGGGGCIEMMQPVWESSFKQCRLRGDCLGGGSLFPRLRHVRQCSRSEYLQPQHFNSIAVTFDLIYRGF